MNLTFEKFCLFVLVGALAGGLACLLLRARGLALWAVLALGVGGAFLGRFVLGLLGFRAGSSLALFLTALGGALLLLWPLLALRRASGGSGGRKTRRK